MTTAPPAPTGARGYLHVLSHPPAVIPFVAAVIGRLPVSMASLGIIVLIESVRGAYTIAGVVTGAFALATATGAPLWGRLMDRVGQPRVIIPTSWASAASLIGLALAAVNGASDPVLIMFAIAAGVSFPPISAAMRAAWRVIYPDPAVRRLGYALDASAVELIFVGGPLLLSLLAAFSPPVVPLLVTGGLMAAGATCYGLTSAARNWRPDHSGPGSGELSAAERGRHTARTALTAPGFAALLTVTLSMAVGFGQLDTSIVATADVVLGSTDKLGLLFAFIAGGSTIGGLVYGSRSWPGDEFRRTALVLGAFALTMIPLPVLLSQPDPPLGLLLPLMFLTGLTIAPVLIMFQNTVDVLAPPHRITEAQAFLSASMTTGAALGTAIGGILIDRAGAPGALTGAIIAVSFASLLCALRVRRWRRLSSSPSPMSPAVGPSVT